MNVEILQLTEGARKARGTGVIIDVFRAFSLACYAMEQGAEKIIPVGTVEEAFALKKKFPASLLVGEIQERMPEGFDYGNSPTQLEGINLSGRTLIHRTSAGTQGLVNAKSCDELITGSFVNAGAIVRYLQKQKPRQVSLVCMGYSTLEEADEDTFCAEWISERLAGRSPDFNRMVEKLRQGSGKRLLDPANQGHSPARDFDLCTDLNRFDFVLKAIPEGDYLSLYRINP